MKTSRGIQSNPLWRHWTLLIGLGLGLAAVRPVAADPTIARIWIEETLAAIRIDKPHPPAHARNLFHVSAAMYDAWAAYDSTALGFLHHERASADDLDAARREAISYAAYRMLAQRYRLSVNAATTLNALSARMAALGFDPSKTNTLGSSPSAVGNRIAADLIEWGLHDGSNEQGGYDDPGYVTPQPPLIVLDKGDAVAFGINGRTDPNRWQPLAFDGAARFQNGLAAGKIQTYLGATWIETLPFALYRSIPKIPWVDPGPPSRLGAITDAEYKDGAVEVLRAATDLESDAVVDRSPGRIGNSSVGNDDGTGYPTNLFTRKPYAPNPVRLGDFTRVMAEYWADGPRSETPPGHWFLIANQVTDHPLTQKRIGGIGPVLGDLEWEIKTYFLLGASVHDAACMAWSVKRFYEGVRPITAIRYLSLLGQSSDPALPSYHPNGMPLHPGLTELVTLATAAPGGRHAGVAEPGEIVVYSWPGEPANPTNQVQSLRWIRGINWVPYQRKTFVTPAFPGYVSGHSTFSRAAAEALSSITGSPYFPGGLGKFTAPQGTFLGTEHGPSATTEIQWATYADAADLAGQSRRWGGIHVPEDDYRGRLLGFKAGQRAWSLVQRYWDASLLDDPITTTITRAPDGRTLTFASSEAHRALAYQLQSSTNLMTWQPASAAVVATDVTLSFATAISSTTRFYRIAHAASVTDFPVFVP